MHTAFGILKDHPDFEKINFIICPLIITKLDSASSVPRGSLETLKAEYEEKFPGASISIMNIREAMQYPEWSELLSSEMESDSEFVSVVEEVLHHPDNYHLNHLQTSLREKILRFMYEKHLKGERPQDYLKEFKNIKIVEYFISNKFSDYSEDDENYRKRVQLFKDYLDTNFKVDELAEHEKIFVVSHKKFLGHLLGYCKTGRLSE